MRAHLIGRLLNQKKKCLIIQNPDGMMGFSICQTFFIVCQHQMLLLFGEEIILIVEDHIAIIPTSILI